MKQLIFFLFATAFLGSLQAQVDRVEPPFWWTGMEHTQLQLMLYGNDLGTTTPTVKGKGVVLTGHSVLKNSNYLILDLEISPQTKKQTIKIKLSRQNKLLHSFDYQLFERNKEYVTRKSFGPSDVLYLITPDRFANGNPANDQIEGMKEKPDRSFKGGRHGGDIRGIIDNLDYIKELGFTAIWVNPVLENDMEEYSYHGYATTDFYKVDPRFGTNEEYVELVIKAHEKGIKVIMDMIVNHCGSFHWWMDDLPADDWLNYQKEGLNNNFMITTHRKTVIQDPYVSKVDYEEFTDGWFVPTMPDLNQRNVFVANYLIQNSIWWIEYAGIDGIRMDTYPYPDKTFMIDWTCKIQTEYPNFNTVGEEWYEDPLIVAYWQEGKQNPDEYTSCLPTLMDFPLQAKLTKGLNEKVSDWSGWVTPYTTLALDFAYSKPEELVVFPDNHDMSRFFTQVNENYDLFKLGIAYFLTIRGTPQIYYGTEVLMKNPGTSDHGIIRSDFPGGWEGDTVNAFTGEGLTTQQKDAQEFFRRILNWRKNKPVIHEGKLLHYNPKNGVYVYFRHNNSSKVMVVLSKNEEDVELDLSRFSEILSGSESGIDIITKNTIKLEKKLFVPAMNPLIIDLNE